MLNRIAKVIKNHCGHTHKKAKISKNNMNDIKKRRPLSGNKLKRDISPYQELQNINRMSPFTKHTTFNGSSDNSTIESDISFEENVNINQNDSQHSIRKHDQSKSCWNQLNCRTLYITIPVLVTVGYFIINRINITSETPLKICPYHELQAIFPNENDIIWRDLSIGFEHVINSKVDKPGVYLFTHNSKEYVQKFVHKLVEKSTVCLENTMNPVELKEEDFVNKNDYGLIIESFKKRLTNSRVVLVTNLNEIPPEAARALHSICDTYSPIKKSLIIFLTLVPSIKNGNPIHNARETLSTMWSSKLKPNQLDALITRLTDSVIPLHG